MRSKKVKRSEEQASEDLRDQGIELGEDETMSLESLLELSDGKGDDEE